MFLKQVCLALVAAFAGLATSAGTFALLVTLGVIPRIIGRSRTAGGILTYETMVSLGGIIGCILSVFSFDRLAVGSWILVVYGLCAGIFVGCQAIALAEILNMFPIMFRRLKLQMGLSALLAAMALGKMAGSIIYFVMGW